jgi:hypothetical protein
VSAFEDRVVQKAVREVLEDIYLGPGEDWSMGDVVQDPQCAPEVSRNPSSHETQHHL